MRLFITVCNSPYAKAGTLLREFDQGFEIQKLIPNKGKPGTFSFESTNIMLPYHYMKDIITPVNLRNRFVYDDGKSWDKIKRPEKTIILSEVKNETNRKPKQ